MAVFYVLQRKNLKVLQTTARQRGGKGNIVLLMSVITCEYLMH